ncbi:MAG: TadE family protein [Terriglobales bacterium]
MQILRRILRETSGAEIAETAAVLPILFTILLGIFFFGRAYNIYGTITQAALQGARAAVAPACATCPGGALPADQVATNVVAPVFQASKLNPAAVQPLTAQVCACGVSCGSMWAACDPAGTSATPSICVQQNVTLSTTAGNQQCGTSVSFQYPYGFNLPFRSFTLQMKATAQMRGEN